VHEKAWPPVPTRNKLFYWRLKPTVFVASSTEGLDLAYAIQKNLEYFAAPTVWSQGVFQASSVVIDQLIKSLDSFRFGIFVFSPDDVVHMRGEERSAPRDNVVFELGLFVGRLGRERNYIVVPRGQSDLRLPTDLLGLTTVSYDETRPPSEYEAALGPACRSVQLAIGSLCTADASGGDPRHTGANILYSSRSAAQLTDFVAYGDRFFGEGQNSPKGTGAFRTQGGVLIVERSNAAGRFLIELRKYQFGHDLREYLPKNELVSGKRILRLTAEAKSTKGARKVIWVLKQRENGARLAEHAEIVEQNEWRSVDVGLRISPLEDCFLRIEDQDITETNSTLHVRNMVLSEQPV
jgi:hypothetical protein